MVLVVLIDDPKNEQYFSGEVAAPTFRNIMTDTLKLHTIVPDTPDGSSPTARLVAADSDT